MPRDSQQFEAIQANYTGRQDLIRGDGTAASSSNTALVGAATQTASLTTVYPIDVKGNANLRVVLRPSVLTGTVTITLRPALRDGVTPDTTVAAVNITPTLATYVAGTIALTGQSIVFLTVVTAAASTVAFDTAEYTAK